MDVIKPLDGRALAQWVADALGRVRETETELVMSGRTYYRIFMVRGWPDEVTFAQFDDLLHFQDLDLDNAHRISVRVIDIMRPRRLEWGWLMRKKLARMRNNNRSRAASEDGLVDRDEVGVEEGLLQMFEACELKRQASFLLWRFIAVQADSLEILNKAESNLRDMACSLGLTLTHLPEQQAEALSETYILGMHNEELLQAWPGRWVHTGALAALLPCTTGGRSDAVGIYLGNRVLDMAFFHYNPTKDAGNHNVLIVGASGEGKSFLLKVIVVGLLLLGFRVFIYDVEHEYQDLCRALGGRYIDQSVANGHFYDPLRLPPACGIAEVDAVRFHETCQHLHATVSLLLNGDYSAVEATAADKALQATWAEAGVLADDQTTWDRPEVRRASFRLWYEKLKEAAQRAGKGSPADALADKLYRWFDGTQSYLFRSSDDTAELEEAQLTVIHVGRQQDDDQIAKVKLQLCNRAVLDTIRRLKARGILSAAELEELQSFLRDPIASRFTQHVATEIRKRDGIVLGAANELSVFDEQAGTEGGRAFWSNSRLKALFWMEDSAIRSVEGKSVVPQPVIEHLRTLHRSENYILRYDGTESWELMHVHVPPEEAALYKTRQVG